MSILTSRSKVGLSWAWFKLGLAEPGLSCPALHRPAGPLPDLDWLLAGAQEAGVIQVNSRRVWHLEQCLLLQDGGGQGGGLGLWDKG